MPHSEAQSWSEGRDGGHRSYRERLYPPIAVFILVIGLGSIVGVAYGAAYGSGLGWLTGILLCLVGIGALLATSTPIHVDDHVVRAGRARLPLTAITDTQTLDADAMRHARRHGDPRDYVVLRAWSSRRGVAIDLADPRDPHPRWIVSSRHPERLAAAIRDAAGETPSPTPGTVTTTDG
jgi:hypothetical protein